MTAAQAVIATGFVPRMNKQFNKKKVFIALPVFQKNQKRRFLGVGCTGSGA